MTIDIKNRWTDAVLWTGEAANLRDAVIQAVAARADLGGADLRGANLRDANLRDADLRDANLGGADLGDADLRGANLGGANLGGANLGGANLGDANLRGANLGGADLGGADLGGANLRDANLRGADLVMFRDDLWAVLSSAPSEAPAVLAALREGKVDGSSYSGECACLVGTIANARACEYGAVPGLKPDARRPAEQWFMQIHPGDTPETKEAAKLAAEWVSEWIERMRGAFGPVRETVS
jgi:hypothetical protein